MPGWQVRGELLGHPLDFMGSGINVSVYTFDQKISRLVITVHDSRKEYNIRPNDEVSVYYNRELIRKHISDSEKEEIHEALEEVFPLPADFPQWARSLFDQIFQLIR